MMVAAHLGDLRAAKSVGLRTAFVPRPLEYGPAGKPDLQPDASVDLAARDFVDLAAKLGVSVAGPEPGARSPEPGAWRLALI